MKNIHRDKILIIDFGSQYTQLIARRVRELGVYCEIYPYSTDENRIREFNARGVILSGGPSTVTSDDTPRAHACIFELGVPVLGICYGMQTMAAQLGGAVENASHHEYGYAHVLLNSGSALFQGIEDSISSEGQSALDVWMSHGDHVTQLPNNFACIASTDNTPIAAMSDESRQFYGVQFHPEVTHTRQGTRIISRFIHEICQCEALWTSENIVEDMITRVRETVGDDRVLLGLSGGVDSSVVAALLHKAIGDKLVCVFVDNGLLRLGESEQVQATFGQHFGVNLIVADAKNAFYDALKDIDDPEEKRKAIGKTFIDVFDAHAKKLENIKWLAQGTIYPDVIESAGAQNNQAHVIKSHHNVGGLPEDMTFKLVEPLRELFKDEVRRIGLELGLPYDMVYRHPFPGPGLGVRILGEVKAEYADILRQADAIFIEELRRHHLYDSVSQAFAVFLPVRSVGVTGDARKYEYVIALRAVETIDFMTATWAHLPYDFLGLVSNRIINEVKHVARVTYDISGKPPSTIEWE